METLFVKHNRLIAKTSLDIVREMMNRVHWNARLLSIQGAKGVGKSTLLKQFVKLNYQSGDRKVLYCSADTIDFSRRTLIDLAEEFVMNGGERLIIDEIHKYEGWSREIKEIYDLYPELKVIISGSSLLSLLAGDADLSRRCIKYTMSGLSFREALRFSLLIPMNCGKQCLPTANLSNNSRNTFNMAIILSFWKINRIILRELNRWLTMSWRRSFP